jgi:hypothetical protein
MFLIGWNKNFALSHTIQQVSKFSTKTKASIPSADSRDDWHKCALCCTLCDMILLLSQSNAHGSNGRLADLSPSHLNLTPVVPKKSERGFLVFLGERFVEPTTLQ